MLDRMNHTGLLALATSITKGLFMTCHGTIELRDLKLDTQIGSYGPEDVIPDAHCLDLTLSISPQLILIDQDRMSEVFDYDPLIAEIDKLARDGHYETQETLITRILAACASYPQIESAEIVLRKSPVRSGSGTLGVRLFADAETLAGMR
jgi:dihydroneopterin aldolase